MGGKGLLDGCPGPLKVAVDSGKVGAAASSRCQSPRAPERLSPCLQLPRERLREIDVAEGGERLDLIGKEFHHARLAKAGGCGLLGQRAQLSVCGLVVAE